MLDIDIAYSSYICWVARLDPKTAAATLKATEPNTELSSKKMKK